MLFTVETKNLTAGHGVFSTTCPAAGHIDIFSILLQLGLPEQTININFMSNQQGLIVINILLSSGL